MAEDLAKISAQNELLNQQVEQIPSLEQELQVRMLLRLFGALCNGWWLFLGGEEEARGYAPDVWGEGRRSGGIEIGHPRPQINVQATGMY